MDYWLILTKKSLLRRYPHISTSSDIGYESVPSKIILLLGLRKKRLDKLTSPVVQQQSSQSSNCAVSQAVFKWSIKKSDVSIPDITSPYVGSQHKHK